MKRVIIVFRGNISLDMYPPLQSIMRVLIDLGYELFYIGGYSADGLRISFEAKGVKFYRLPLEPLRRSLSKLIYFWKTKRQVIDYLRQIDVNGSDVIFILERKPSSYLNLWQFGYLTNEYNVIFRISENIYSKVPLWVKILYGKTNISDVLNKSKGIICCEYNRAHILKGVFGLARLPHVLPNKPYVDYNVLRKLPNSLKDKIDRIRHQIGSRKVILYQGIFLKERRLDEFCEAINELTDYVLLILAKESPELNEFKSKYKSDKIIFIPFINSPFHLCITRMARIGILTYMPKVGNIFQVANVLYCAPNKTFEYGKFSIPMIANDLPALRTVFDKYNAGICVNTPYDKDEIKKAIRTIDSNYEVYAQGAKSYYDSVDMLNLTKDAFEK